MSSLAQDLDDTLRRIDPQAAQRVERLVREILVLAESPSAGDGDGPSLVELAAHAEPMGVLTNAEIDQAIRAPTNLSEFAGSLRLAEDPLTFQHRMREEWE